MSAWAESLRSRGGFGLPGSQQLRAGCGSCSCGCGQLHSFAHASLQDLARLFLSLSGPFAQRDAIGASLFVAAGVTGARALPGPASPVTSSAPLARTSGSVPTSGGATPVSAASATSSSGRHERALESPRSERQCWRSSSGGRSRSGEKRHRCRSPFPARSSRSAHASTSLLAASSDAGDQEATMPPPSSGRSGVRGGCPESDCSAPGRDRSPQPVPSGLGLGVRSSPGAAWSRSGFAGRSSPAPLGVAEDNRASTSDSLDLDRDDSFRAVLCLIQEFHRLEEPASVAPNGCKTSLAPVYGLQSESSQALHLPLSPSLGSLLEDTNLALSKFVEDQTVHFFLPVPDHRQRKYYKTSSSSFPGPYSVLPGLASITLEKVSESKKCSVSLSHSQVSSLETMLSSVCEVNSWLDWWFSTCGGFREHLPDEVRGNFERLMLSGSRALEFLGGQGVTALGNLVLSRRHSLLLDVRSMVPAEEVARLHFSALPSSAALFHTPLLDSALTKMRAASNEALVQQALHPPKFPRKSLAGPVKAGSSSASSADHGGISPVAPRSQSQASTDPSSSSSQSGRKRRSRKGKAPFSSVSGGSSHSRGKRKRAGKKSA